MTDNIEQAMGTVYLTNIGDYTIYVRVTSVSYSGGSEAFVEINPGSTYQWTRNAREVAFIQTNDSNQGEVLIVEPGSFYSAP